MKIQLKLISQQSAELFEASLFLPLSRSLARWTLILFKTKRACSLRWISCIAYIVRTCMGIYLYDFVFKVPERNLGRRTKLTKYLARFHNKFRWVSTIFHGPV